MAFNEKSAARVRKVLAPETPVEKRMFGGLAFLVRGNMCIGLVRDDLVVRVGPEADAEALREPYARPMDFTGKPMKGWIFVGPEGFRTAAALGKWIRRGLEYAQRLPSKKEK